jgi:hypothetical protein
MDVAVDESRRDRRVGQIDALRIRGSCDAVPTAPMRSPVDEHGAWTQGRATTAIDERAGRD